VETRVSGAASVDDEEIEGVATAREEKEEATGVGIVAGGGVSRLCESDAGDVARAKGGGAGGGVREEACAAVRQAEVTRAEMTATAVTAGEPERSMVMASR
jgi:hypothetical protein